MAKVGGYRKLVPVFPGCPLTLLQMFIRGGIHTSAEVRVIRPTHLWGHAKHSEVMKEKKSFQEFLCFEDRAETGF